MQRVRYDVSQMLYSTNVCPPQCEHSLYTTVVSSHVWPVSWQVLSASNTLIIPNNVTMKTIKEGWLKVSVYFESPKVLSIDESPMLDIFNLLADVGGHLGLWVGLSLLAVCEFLEIVFDFIQMWFTQKE